MREKSYKVHFPIVSTGIVMRAWRVPASEKDACAWSLIILSEGAILSSATGWVDVNNV